MDPVPPGAVVLRPLTKEDVPALARLAHEQGRNILLQDYERFLALEGARGFVLERDGALVGGVTAMRYFEHAFLGPVIVAGAGDATGLAIALLVRTIETMQREGVDLIEAEAGEVEEAILARMGFVTQRRTLVLERERSDGGPVPGPGPGPGNDDGRRTMGATGSSAPMETAHMLDVGSIDAAAVGYGRKQYIAALRDEMPEGARVTLADGDVTGYALLRRAARGYHLGPLVTRRDDPRAATSLLLDTLRAANGATIVLLVPEGSALLPILAREGFREVGVLARMSASMRAAPDAAASKNATEWAIGGRMTG